MCQSWSHVTNVDQTWQTAGRIWRPTHDNDSNTNIHLLYFRGLSEDRRVGEYAFDNLLSISPTPLPPSAGAMSDHVWDNLWRCSVAQHQTQAALREIKQYQLCFCCMDLARKSFLTPHASVKTGSGRGSTFRARVGERKTPRSTAQCEWARLPSGKPEES